MSKRNTKVKEDKPTNAKREYGLVRHEGIGHKVLAKGKAEGTPHEALVAHEDHQRDRRAVLEQQPCHELVVRRERPRPASHVSHHSEMSCSLYVLDHHFVVEIPYGNTVWALCANIFDAIKRRNEIVVVECNTWDHFSI